MLHKCNFLGNGGNAGRIKLHSRKITGDIKLKSCRGSGAPPAKNGRGGQGGAGGQGGYGRDCQWVPWRLPLRRPFCRDEGASSRASSGARGDNGAPGTTSRSRGKDGAVGGSYIRSATLDTTSKSKFPVKLLKIMRRQAEDLLLGNSNDQKGRDALEFIRRLASERNDVDKIKKAVQRKLGFLGKAGYDIFGKNKYFAPRMKWEALEGAVDDIKTLLDSYEYDFNKMESDIENNKNFKQVASKMTAISKEKVKSEEGRLVAAMDVAKKEKELYVKSIQHLEQQLSSTLESVNETLKEAYHQAKFNKNDLLAVLQGITGFIGGLKDKDPFAVIDSVVGVIGSQAGKTCLGSLQSNLATLKKWMTFGKYYKPLVDSSDLDFDQMDVGSVPEIMQVSLEVNKEKLAEGLVCLLDVASRPQDIAEFKQVIESFFITGAARIDLIAKVMDLDNDIGGYSFDIDVLKKTQEDIEKIGKTQDTSEMLSLQQTFLENLLSTYRGLERSFMRNVYELQRAFEFRSLWQGINLLRSFQRVASESAPGTGQLSGADQLNRVYSELKALESKAVECFTTHSYTTGLKKWTFDKENDKVVFEQLAKGYTRFSLDIQRSCSKCFNMRLLKIYIELYGSLSQPANVPDKIHLKVRHLSGSFFRAGDNTTKQYRVPVGAYKNIKFDRFTLTNKETCKNRKKAGKDIKCSFVCIDEGDSRLQPMCTNQLNKGGSSRQDKLLGMEECTSPFGTYELEVPVDKNLACEDTGITSTNCKDLDLIKFTHMNVYTHFVYWSDQYPTGPDDPICRSPGKLKRNVTANVGQQFPGESDDKDLC
ncbi:uncharacterized protein LOC144629949 isoform X1 [Oculina patagonica]